MANITNTAVTKELRTNFSFEFDDKGGYIDYKGEIEFYKGDKIILVNVEIYATIEVTPATYLDPEYIYYNNVEVTLESVECFHNNTMEELDFTEENEIIKLIKSEL